MRSLIFQCEYKKNWLSVVALCVLLIFGVSGCATSGGQAGKPVGAQLTDKDAPLEGPQSNTLSKQQKVLWFFSPYRPVIQQGNFISKEMVAKLKEGMTQMQVKYVLGTPLLRDIFHRDRWDYSFSLKQHNGNILSSRVTVFFKDDKLDRMQSEGLPTEREFIDRIAGDQLKK